MQPFRFLRDLVRSFLRHGCASLAASLAFFSLLSLFPLVFLLLYGLSFVVSHAVIGLVLLLSYGATQIVNFLTRYAPRLWGLDLLALAAHDLFLTYTLPFALAFLTVTGLYRLVPRRPPQWREAMIGALTFSLLWIAAKLLFVTYSTYATVYAHL